VLVLFLFLFSFLNVFFVRYVGVPFSPIAISGHVVNDSGVVKFFVQGGEVVTISSPENTTYDFDVGDPYLIDLNVSTNFPVEAVDGWKYSLYDLRHSVYVEEDTIFSPNSSISAGRWGNLLTVFAHEEDGSWFNASVIFFVNVSNSAPILGSVDEPILVCEATAISYDFNASDIDEDDLVGDISSKNPFYLNSLGKSGLNISLFRIISGVLEKDDVGSYAETLSVVDPYDLVDSYLANISVIEINNPPVMTGLGAQTVWLQGENSSFDYQMVVTDVEDGVVADENFSFNLTWGSGENLFSINSTTGVMNYSPVVGHEGKVYSLTVCVADNALGSVHENISLCLPRSDGSESVCDDFSLTVTDENRAPEIVSYAPTDANFSVGSTTSFSFFVEVYDADGTIPDIDWYVDGVLEEHNENASNDSFSYVFGCGVSGEHYVEIVTSDGLLNDSQRWNVSVVLVACPVVVPGVVGGGAGGAGGAGPCRENWVCDDWKICQNTERSFDSKMLSLEDYILTKEKCAQVGYEDERFCGFQITSCFDLNNCSRSALVVLKPSEVRICYFTEDPNCYDGITNCHDGACELLVDCGGPCELCATCSDREQNQGEKGIDCGGPCPFACEPEEPSDIVWKFLIGLFLFLVLLILYILYRVVELVLGGDGEKRRKRR